VGVYMCGFCNVWVCVGLDFVVFGCVYVWVCACVDFVMCGCVYVWVL